MASRKPDVLPWSYSSLTAFETCPRRFQLTRLTRQVTEPQNEAMRYGNEVHKAIELHLKGEQDLPQMYDKFLPVVERIRQQPGEKLVEYQFGLTDSYQPTTFFGADVWFRGVIDAGIIGKSSATLIDWKLGKPKTDGDQLKLFAAAGFASFPALKEVKTGYIWLSYGKLDARTFTRDNTVEIWREFTPRVIRMVKALEADRFPPKPSGLCKAWCPVPRSLCEFSGKP